MITTCAILVHTTFAITSIVVIFYLLKIHTPCLLEAYKEKEYKLAVGLTIADIILIAIYISMFICNLTSLINLIK